MRQKWVLTAMCSCIGIILLDESAVAIVLNDIRSDFGLSRSQVNWVLTVYLVCLSATVAAFGRIADLIGLKAVMIAGTLVFGLSSIAAGLATNPALLLTSRAIQGFGAAAAFPTSAGIIRAITPPDRLGSALGYFGLASAIGLMTGPLLGGWLSEHISWRAIFFLNAPIVTFIVLTTSIGFTNLEYEKSKNAQHSFDWLGFALLTIALGALVTALMQGPSWGWTSLRATGLFLLSMISLVAFAITEPKHPNPILETDLFQDQTFTSANVTTFFAQFAKTSVIVYCPYYMIDELELSPFEAGNGLLPGIIMATFVAPWTGRIVDRRGARLPVLLALCALALSMFYLAFAVTFRNYATLVPGLIGWGYGATAMFAGSRRAIQSSVPASASGQASGINSTAQWLGAALAVPIFGAFVHQTPHFSLLYFTAGLTVAVTAVGVWRYFHPGR